MKLDQAVKILRDFLKNDKSLLFSQREAIRTVLMDMGRVCPVCRDTGIVRHWNGFIKCRFCEESSPSEKIGQEW